MRSTLVVAALASILLVAVGCQPKTPPVTTTDTSAQPRPAGSETVGPPMTSGDMGTVPAADPYHESTYTGLKVTDPKPPVVKSGSKTYTVAAHDTIYGIARTQLGNGSRAKDIIALNPGIDANHIKPGQVLNMPEK